MSIISYTRVFAAGIGIVLLTVAVAGGFPNTTAELCDALAADTDDPGAKAHGVALYAIDAEPAIAACRDAASRYPDSLRFRYQLSRALIASQDTVAGFSMLLESADQGHPVAQYRIGNLGLAGIPVNGNVPDYEIWLSRAAQQGLPQAQADIGALYLSGRLGEHKVAEGHEWLTSAENTGSLYARTVRQSLLYLDAEKRSDKPALSMAHEELMEIATEGGTDAMLFLARILTLGVGLPTDIHSAADWYELAAEAGSAVAQRELAHVYELGIGRQRDQERVRYWLARAAAGGDISAKTHLKLIDSSEPN
ncbi:MAG: sel1 repeat family protein [Parvibaculum sp.]|nr:sel1 repeat family protein [Parvibaculum sp.]